MVRTFASDTTSYIANVANSVSSITVTPETVDTGASVEVSGTVVTSGLESGAINLNVGSNTITIETTVQDGTTNKTYTVIVTREVAVSGGSSYKGHHGGKIISTDGTIVMPVGYAGELSLLGRSNGNHTGRHFR